MSQFVLNTSWLPAAYCHRETGATNSVLGLEWTSIWESGGLLGQGVGRDRLGVQLLPWGSTMTAVVAKLSREGNVFHNSSKQ